MNQPSNENLKRGKTAALVLDQGEEFGVEYYEGFLYEGANFRTDEEVDLLITLRRLIFVAGTCESSNIDLAFPSSAPPLYEAYVPISQQKFEEVWATHLAKYQVQWEQVKGRYPIGMDITGSIALFVPPGTIRDFAEHSHR